KREADLAIWRSALLKALDPNARLMTDLIPELKLIIGDQPPLPEVEPQQAQSRFQLVFRRLMGVFARQEHPLALFFDDLQWLDAATLDLLEDLLTRSDLQHVMLIGAYRDNEVDGAHPLTRKLDAIRQAGARVQEIRLAPLAREHVEKLIADALHCKPKCAAPLAHLVHEKTAGNPFFVIQFLYSLTEEGLLRFDHDAACWSWDLDRIHSRGYTENVVNLMVGKLARLPAETQQALQQLACLGNIAATAMLSTVLGIPEEQVHVALWPSVHQELVERLEGSYKFMHDRVQEAAYSLIPEALRAEVHVRIGRLLVTQTPPEKREEAIFDIVNQLNRGPALITKQEEREQLADLNLIAGKRAKGSTAYASALNYLNAGVALLAEDSWERQHELIFALELNRAECEFLTGQLSVADKRLAALSDHTTTTIERALVSCLRIDVCTTLDESGRAVAVCLDYLRHVGIEWLPHPQEDEVRREYERIWSRLAGRTIEELIDLPLMEDAPSLATVEVLSKLLPPAVFTDANLASMTICKAISLSLERGNCDASCFSYTMLGKIAGSRFGDYQAGFRFGQLGYELLERRGLKRFEARTYHSFSLYAVRWTKHVRASRDLLRRAFEAANRIGDLTYGVYTCCHINSDLLFAGEPLAEVQREAERGLAFATKARFGLVSDWITTQLALIRMLRGLALKFGCLDDGHFDELKFEHHLSSNPALTIAACWYRIRKLQARYIAGDYIAAIDAAAKVQQLLWTSSSHYEDAEYHFYAALTKAACCDSVPAGERQQHIDAVAEHHKQLQVWAENCPENFENRAALVGAEIARLEGRELDAERLYQQAIRSAHENGFVHNEALAYERASEFNRARGFDEFADLYLRNARYCYLRWGADGKVRQLDQLYPQLIKQEAVPHSRSTIGTSIEHLDLATILRVSQAVSSEIVLEKLIETVLRTAIEYGGAERGLLIQPCAAELRVQAEATLQGSSVTIVLADAPMSSAELPESVLQYAARTQESVILEDASARGSFSNDDCFRRSHTRSILCLPLVKQGRLVALLYLENNLAANAFTPARLAVLNVLASAAAISIENSRLYRDVQDRESKIRRLVDANIVGVLITDLDGRILEANDAFLQMIRYTRDDLTSGRLRWTDLTPPEWQAVSNRAVAQLTTSGACELFEKEYFRSNGTRVPVLVGLASLEGTGTQNVAFVLDLTERKRAEQARQEIEEQWRAAFESNPTMYFIVDAAGTIVSVNAFGAEQLGYGLSELVGRPVLNVFYEPDRQAVQSHTNVCFEQPGRMMRWEARKIRKDGTMLWVRETAKAVVLKKRPVLLVVCEDITEQKRAEDAARRSEKETRAVINSVPALVWSTSADGAFDFVNQRWQEFTGLAAEDAWGWKWEAAVHPDDRSRFIAEWRAALENGQAMETEARLRWSDGEYHWFLIRDVPLRDELGNILKWYGTGIDIEDRKRAEEKLHAAMSERTRLTAFRAKIGMALAHEENLRTTLQKCTEAMVRHLDSAFARVWTLSSDGRELHLQASAGMYTRLDGSHSRIRVGQLKIGLIAQERKAYLTHDIQNDPGFHDKEWARRERIVSLAGYPLLVEDRVVGVMGMYSQKPIPESTLEALSFIVDGMAQGIDRKRAEEALRRSEAYLAEAQRLTHTGSWAWNPANDTVLHWSKEMFRIFALDRQQALPPTETFWERIPPQDRGCIYELLRKAVQERTEYVHDHRIVLPDGTVKQIHAIGHPVFEDGEVVEFIGSSMDVTEQVRNREALEKAFEEIKALKDQLHKENLALRDEVDRTSMFEEIVGASPALQAVLARVSKVCPTDSTVL
ncbi:MAG TPA: PAS domain S-box protein, partial [Bryobacteraceae bacterium]|nr:PAS domain S-box protein [Bryobacteraceae bacterium]